MVVLIVTKLMRLKKMHLVIFGIMGILFILDLMINVIIQTILAIFLPGSMQGQASFCLFFLI